MRCKGAHVRFALSVTPALLWTILGTGCGSDGLNLAPVNGTVTLDGKPVKGASVEFIPQAPGGSVAYGTTDENGNYSMYFGSSGTGAVVGRSLVRITSDDQVSVGGTSYARKEVFPQKYNANSELFVDVVSGSNKFDFPCESGGKQPKPTGGAGT
jgi:hypothetical protein